MNGENDNLKKRIKGIWTNMIRRCYDENSKQFKYYGGRGIIVCDEWLNDLEAFYNWAILNGYSNSLTIDRIDNDGNYSPDNCRWATVKEQSINRSNTVFLTLNNVKKPMVVWCEELGLDRSVVYNKYKKGCSAKECLTINHKPKKRNKNNRLFPNLRAEIISNGLTMGDFAEAIGMDKSSFSKRMSGQTDFTLKEVVSIKRQLGCSLTLDELFEPGDM